MIRKWLINNYRIGIIFLPINMPEGEIGIEKGSKITVETVLQSIEKTEEWWEQLQNLIQQGKPVVEFISDAIGVLNELEVSAQNPQSQLPKTSEEAAKIRALWVISAPGTYFQAEKEDRYKGKKWALWNDRHRVNYAFKIGRELVAINLGHPLNSNWVKSERELDAFGPLIVYNGTPVENAAILEVTKAPWFRISEGLIYPRSKVVVINPFPSIDNTIDQIITFRLPTSYAMSSGDEIGIVIHAPQAVRFLYTLANLTNVIPQGTKLRVFSLPTPIGGYPEYPLQELRGMVNYRFIADPPKVAHSPYPYKVK